MMILKIGTFLGIENFPWTCIFLLYFNQRTYFPESQSNWFEELILADWQAKILAVFLENFFVDDVGSWISR